MRIHYDDWRKMVFRIGWTLPLTPWFVVIHYMALPDYSTGRHSANALFSVAQSLTWINLGFSVTAVVAILCGKADSEIKALAFVSIVIHYFIFEGFIFSNAIAYA